MLPPQGCRGNVTGRKTDVLFQSVPPSTCLSFSYRSILSELTLFLSLHAPLSLSQSALLFYLVVGKHKWHAF